MHSFIRTYPSLASAASGSAASSSNISRSGDEDENGSICCDIYIDGDDASQIQKGGSSSTSSKPLHVAAVLRGRGIPPEPAPEREKRRICSFWRVTLILAAIVVGAIVLGISVGVSRAKKHQQQHAGVPFGPGSPGSLDTSSVTITVPFAASAHIDIPPGGLSCDALFGDEQDLESFIDKLEAAHTRKMAQYQVDEVVVTELQCNNFSYPVPAETFLTGKPAPALLQAFTAAGGLPPQGHHRRRRLASTQHQAAAAQATTATVQQQTYKLANGVSSAAADGAYGSEELLRDSSSSSSSSSGSHKQLLVYVELEAKHREQLEKVPVISSHIDWIQRVSKAGAALAGQLVVEILSAEFRLSPGSCAADAVQQLNVEIISSQMVYDDILSPVTQAHSVRKGYKGSTVVTRTEIDPLTGQVIESQTMRLPVLPDYLPELLPDLPITQDGGGTTAAAPAPGTAAPSSTTAPADSSQPAAAPTQHAPAPTCEGDGEGEDVCGLPNTASSACVAGACQVVACAPGWEDCDGNPQNGCEANVLGFFTDDNHCGSCNKVCLSPLKCQLGKCGVRPPAPPTPITPSEEQPSEDEYEDEAVTEEPTGQQQPSTQQPAQGGEGPAGAPGSDGQPGEQQEPKPETPPKSSDQKPKPDEEPSTAVPTLPPVGPTEPQAPTAPTKKPEPATPGVPATKPEMPPAVKPHPKPHKPGKPLPRHISLHDDVARISPSQPELILDVISNDDLRGADPSTATLSVLAQPSVGTVTVLPVSGPHTHPRLLYKQGKDKLEPGSEVEVFYTVKVPGQPQPAPGTALLLGAVTPSDSVLSDCSTAAGATVRGAPIPGLTRADDAAVSVKLPFPVRLHGAPYSTATISSNGWVSLGEQTGAQEPCNVEGSWPNAACLGAGPVLAPFWDDLVVDQVLTHHDTHLEAYVIQWTNAMAPAAKLPIGTFQAWMFANGTVGFVYRDLYGIEQALGSSAVAGIRGPAVKAKPYVTKLMSKAFESVGSGSDEHGSWLFSAALDETSDYATLLGIHRRFLNPGMAVISHPGPVTGTPSKFKPWSTGSSSSRSSSLWPLLVSPDAPARPLLQQLVQAPVPAAVAAAAGAAAALTAGSSDKGVVTLTWDFPGDDSHTPLSPTFYKLYLAADPYFNEMLRQPATPAFKSDIPPNTRSVDVELNAGHTHNDVYALLLACNSHACSRSCIGRYSLK